MQDECYKIKMFHCEHCMHPHKHCHHCCAIHVKLEKLNFEYTKLNDQMRLLNKNMLVLYKLFMSDMPDSTSNHNDL